MLIYYIYYASITRKRVYLHFVVRGILNSLERKRKRVLLKLTNWFLTKY